MNPENINLNEFNQGDLDQNHNFSPTYNAKEEVNGFLDSKTDKNHEKKSQPDHSLENETEDDEPLDGKTRFEGAINSAHVAADGSYMLAFMEPGEYELIVVKYNNRDGDEDLEYLGEVSLDIKINELSRNSVNVSSDTYVVANIVLL